MSAGWPFLFDELQPTHYNNILQNKVKKIYIVTLPNYLQNLKINITHSHVFDGVQKYTLYQ